MIRPMMAALAVAVMTANSGAQLIYRFETSRGRDLATIEFSQLPAIVPDDVVKFAYLDPTGNEPPDIVEVVNLGYLYGPRPPITEMPKGELGGGTSFGTLVTPVWGPEPGFGPIEWIINDAPGPWRLGDFIEYRTANSVFEAEGRWLLVPEPSSCGLLLVACLFGLGVVDRRRQAKSS